MNNPGREHGFSLIELAVVLVIVGLLVGGGIAALDATQTQAQRSEQKRQLAQVRAALYGFSMINGRLPCADIDGDGEEDYDGTQCVAGAERGALPSKTLGLAHRDAWGYPLYYAVTASYAGAPDQSEPETSAFDFDSVGAITVDDDHDASDPATKTLADQVPALVMSFAAQGGQVWTGSGFNCPGTGSGFSDNETENCDDDNRFVDAGFVDAASGERFDDMLTWLPDPVLKARMVDAERLP